MKLKSVDMAAEADRRQSMQPELDGMAGALAKALAMRQTAIQGSDDEAEDDDFEDDDDWED